MTSHPKDDYGCIHHALRGPLLERMNLVAKEMGGLTREAALLSLMQTFARQYEIVVPDEPVALPYRPNEADPQGEYKSKHSVSVLSPKNPERDWLRQLVQAAGETSPHKLIRRVIVESATS